jgi:hypothetical protein
VKHEIPDPAAHHPAVVTAVFTDVSYTAVVWDDRSYTVHTLGLLGSAIWTALDGVTTASAIADQLEELGLTDGGGANAVHDALGEFWSLGLLAGSPGRPRRSPTCSIG